MSSYLLLPQYLQLDGRTAAEMEKAPKSSLTTWTSTVGLTHVLGVVHDWCNVMYFLVSPGIYFIIQNYKIYKYSDYTNRLIENSAEIWTKGSGTIGGGASFFFVSNSCPFCRKTRI